MTGPQDELQIVRSLVDVSSPSPGEEAAALRALNRAIAAERARGVRRRSWVRRPVAALAGGALSVLVAIVVLVGVLAVRTPPVQASLDAIAVVAEARPALTVPAGRFLYLRSERTDLVQFDGGDLPDAGVPVVSFLLPQVREVWLAGDGSRTIRTTTGEPEFFSDTVAVAFTAADLGRVYGVGTTVTETFDAPQFAIDPASFPADPDLLRPAMEAYADEFGSGLPLEAELMDLAGVLLRESTASPELRAGLIRVLADLDGIELIDDGANSGTVSVAVSYTIDDLAATVRLDFDRVNSELSGERLTVDSGIAAEGIPPGTVVSRARHDTPVLVDTIVP